MSEGELPVHRRETPEALAAYARPRARFPFGAVALATLIAWLTLPLWYVLLALGSQWPPLGPDYWNSLTGWGVFGIYVLLFGAIPAAVIGLPLGALLVRLLRGVPHAALHLAAFLALGAVVGLVTIRLVMGSRGPGIGDLVLFVPATALASATGWFVTRRHLLPPESR